MRKDLESFLCSPKLHYAYNLFYIILQAQIAVMNRMIATKLYVLLIEGLWKSCHQI